MTVTFVWNSIRNYSEIQAKDLADPVGGNKLILLEAPVRLLSVVNSTVLTVGRQLAWIALAIMVIVILAQIFFRYVLGDALAWSEELARFFMLWMTGLIAPSAYRWGGFVAIDMLPQALPARFAAVLNLALLGVAMMVLVIAIQLGWSDVFGFGGRFATASLKLPLSLVGGEDLVIRRAWMMASLLGRLGGRTCCGGRRLWECRISDFVCDGKS